MAEMKAVSPMMQILLRKIAAPGIVLADLRTRRPSNTPSKEALGCCHFVSFYEEFKGG
jgi:hypothetical protein